MSPLYKRGVQVVEGQGRPCDHEEASGTPCCEQLTALAEFRSRSPITSPRWVDRAVWSVRRPDGRALPLVFCPFCGVRLDPERVAQGRG